MLPPLLTQENPYCLISNKRQLMDCQVMLPTPLNLPLALQRQSPNALDRV